MEKKRVKVLSGFRVTIPEGARNRLPIKIGEELDFTVEGNRLVYTVKELPEDPVFAMMGLAGGEAQELGEAEEAVIGEVKDKLKRSQG
ncbi:MAG: AbrB/MazE/SpoVT family DNA-binding domain-containing protein [Candidatus Bathyarchaeia archaeon]